MSRLILIVNPAAKSGYAAQLVEPVLKELGQQDITIHTTTQPGDAERFAFESCTPDIQAIIVLGGDGTVQEVVNGILKQPETNRPPLAIIPCGSGNDSARMAKLPLDARQAAALVANNVTKRFDVGLCNGRYFVNSFSVGLDAVVAEKTIDYKRERKLSGIALYGAALLWVITHQLHPVTINIEIDGEPAQRSELILAAVTNGRTYGSGIAINPMADPHDAFLTLGRVTWMGLGRILLALPLLTVGKHPVLKEYSSNTLSTCRISSTDGSNLTAQTDGELVYDSTFDISVVPNALELIVDPAAQSLS